MPDRRTVTVTVNGFDTHDDCQYEDCQQLAALLGHMMTQLGSAMEKTTIIVASDFDRTATYNSSGGTDHWTSGSIALFGNGVVPGAIGERGEYPGETPSENRPPAAHQLRCD